MKKMGFCTTTA